MKNKRILMVLVFLILLNLVSYNIYASTRVEPSRFILNTKLDSRNTGVINVVNTGNEQMLLQAYLFDWDLEGVNKKGGITTYEPGTLESSLNNLIKFNPRNFILDPGQSQTVRFTINTPENLKRELRGVVFFENQRDLSEEEGGARVITQVGSIIYLVPDKVEYVFKMLEARFATQIEGRPDTSLLLVKNECQAHIRFTTNYSIINENGEFVEEGFIEEKVMLPNQEERVIIVFKNDLKPGDYKLLLDYNLINNDKKAHFEVPFEVE